MNKKALGFLIFIVFLLLYYAGSFSRISFGDSIGFILDAEKREFMTNFMPLTHFLYTNTAVFFSKYVGMDSVFVMRIMSVLPAAITVSLVFFLIREFVEENWIAIMSSVIFGLSFTFWRSAETVEVYTFNALWVVAFLLCSLKSLRNHSGTFIIFAGIILGLSLWVHIQNILLIPAYLVMLYLMKSVKKSVLVSLACFSVIFFVMFAVNSIQNIEPKYVFFSKEEFWVTDTFSQSFIDLLKDCIKALAFLFYNFNIFVIFSIGGMIYLYKKFRTETFFFVTAALFTLGFATFYAVSDNYVFFIPFYIIFTILIALGIKKASSRYKLRKLAFTPVLTPLFYIFCMYAVSFAPQGKKFHQDKLYKGGLSYYMLPWLHDNIGCIEFTLQNRKTTDDVGLLKQSSREFIRLRNKYQSIEEIRKL